MTTDPSVHLAQHAPELPRERLLKQIVEDSALPTLGAAIGKVVEITSSGEDSVAKLAHFVLADVGLTQKILRIANTIHYRTSSGMPVTTISRAIFLLGFNTVKTCALALLMVDCFKSKSHAQSVRRELMQALCASVVGCEMAQRGRYQDSEEAAVAALFKNIGRVLVASFDHELYQRIHQLAAKSDEPAAANTLLGCSYERFGELALQEWKIPDTIVHALAPLNPSEYKKAANRADWMRQVASFSADVAHNVMRSGSGDLAERCKPVLQRFGKALEIDQQRMQEMLDKVKHETRQLARSLDISLSDLHEAPVEEQAAVLAEFQLQSFDGSATEESARHASGKPYNARDLLLAGVQDVTQMLASEKFKLNDLLLLVLETLHNSMGFRFATVCLRDLHSARYLARVAVGEQYAERQKEFKFNAADTQDIFHLAMSNNVDLLISDASVPKIQNLLPAWHRALLPDARSFIVLPLVIQKKPLGLFYADRAVSAEEGVPPDETALIKTLKGQLLAAMMRP